MAARLVLTLYTVVIATFIFVSYFKSTLSVFHLGYTPGQFAIARFPKTSRFLESLLFTSTCRYSPTRRPAARLRRGIVVLSKHGYTLLSAPDLHPVLDITIYKDIAINPGPEDDTSEKHELKCANFEGIQQDTYIATNNYIVYSRSTLLSLRAKYKLCYDRQILKDLKDHGLLP